MAMQKIFALEILDSRGNPTVEVDLYTTKGRFRAVVPSGALQVSMKLWNYEMETNLDTWAKVS